jgi:hypothetical protein
MSELVEAHDAESLAKCSREYSTRINLGGVAQVGWNHHNSDRVADFEFVRLHYLTSQS